MSDARLSTGTDAHIVAEAPVHFGRDALTIDIKYRSPDRAAQRRFLILSMSCRIADVRRSGIPVCDVDVDEKHMEGRPDLTDKLLAGVRNLNWALRGLDLRA
jgi:hypothetical protein